MRLVKRSLHLRGPCKIANNDAAQTRWPLCARTSPVQQVMTAAASKARRDWVGDDGRRQFFRRLAKPTRRHPSADRNMTGRG